PRLREADSPAERGRQPRGRQRGCTERCQQRWISIASLLYHRLPRRRVVHLCEQLRQDMLTQSVFAVGNERPANRGPPRPPADAGSSAGGLQPMEVARASCRRIWRCGFSQARVAVRIDKNGAVRAATGSTSSYFTAEEFAREPKFGSTTKLRQERRAKVGAAAAVAAMAARANFKTQCIGYTLLFERSTV
uniref:DUF2263 domain-containing protein n=1 Tax=Macrostomum lignano TaxID=282301 RepID=A0A1I8FCF3_9PLAT